MFVPDSDKGSSMYEDEEEGEEEAAPRRFGASKRKDWRDDISNLLPRPPPTKREFTNYPGTDQWRSRFNSLEAACGITWRIFDTALLPPHSRTLSHSPLKQLLDMVALLSNKRIIDMYGAYNGDDVVKANTSSIGSAEVRRLKSDIQEYSDRLVNPKTFMREEMLSGSFCAAFDSCDAYIRDKGGAAKLLVFDPVQPLTHNLDFGVDQLAGVINKHSDLRANINSDDLALLQDRANWYNDSQLNNNVSTVDREVGKMKYAEHRADVVISIRKVEQLWASLREMANELHASPGPLSNPTSLRSVTFQSAVQTQANLEKELQKLFAKLTTVKAQFVASQVANVAPYAGQPLPLPPGIAATAALLALLINLVDDLIAVRVENIVLGTGSLFIPNAGIKDFIGDPPASQQNLLRHAPVTDATPISNINTRLKNLRLNVTQGILGSNRRGLDNLIERYAVMHAGIQTFMNTWKSEIFTQLPAAPPPNWIQPGEHTATRAVITNNSELLTTLIKAKLQALKSGRKTTTQLTLFDIALLGGLSPRTFALLSDSDGNPVNQDFFEECMRLFDTRIVNGVSKDETGSFDRDADLAVTLFSIPLTNQSVHTSYLAYEVNTVVPTSTSLFGARAAEAQDHASLEADIRREYKRERDTYNNRKAPGVYDLEAFCMRCLEKGISLYLRLIHSMIEKDLAKLRADQKIKHDFLKPFAQFIGLTIQRSENANPMIKTGSVANMRKRIKDNTAATRDAQHRLALACGYSPDTIVNQSLIF